ncbi:retinol dehydrogenase 7-like [Bradysia coprophila]|uniref:retinol dehydrogenase 7-like n=1 Tax=Bradysia coprophila TaxID=38358 RepID=UPI00187DD0AC|nr:retinol dehydrogenase 7-like [Bradysia coprophila]XP_037039811.1 retinol dehydrogenase 7-like [Bradysia coprophila]XP_037039812.1 retinol dehydrogenase 7-like [Bradysia coprophila]
MALVKVVLTVVLFYCLIATQRYWYFLISWFVNVAVIASISWWIARRITRDFLCKTIFPRVDPTGKAVLITGCDSGFGHMTAIELNRIGFFVFATCLDSNGEGAKELLTNAQYRNRIVTLKMNVTNPDEISAAFDRVQHVLSDSSSGTNELYAMVNNAGIGLSSPIEWAKENSLDPYDTHIDVNTMGVIRVTRKFLPLIRKSKGRIVNLSSIAARTNLLGINPYSVSKAATSKFTEGLQEELAPFGVTSIDVNPWFFKTPILNPQNIITSAFKRYNESTEDVRTTYGPEWLRRVAKGVVTLVTDPNIVIQHPEQVVDTLVDAITSAEPDAVYRVISPGIRGIFWVISDFLPWELIIYSRRLLNKLQDLRKVNVDEYLSDSMFK